MGLIQRKWKLLLIDSIVCNPWVTELSISFMQRYASIQVDLHRSFLIFKIIGQKGGGIWFWFLSLFVLSDVYLRSGVQAKLHNIFNCTFSYFNWFLNLAVEKKAVRLLFQSWGACFFFFLNLRWSGLDVIFPNRRLNFT